VGTEGTVTESPPPPPPPHEMRPKIHISDSIKPKFLLDVMLISRFYLPRSIKFSISFSGNGFSDCMPTSSPCRPIYLIYSFWPAPADIFSCDHCNKCTVCQCPFQGRHVHPLSYLIYRAKKQKQPS